MLNVHREIELDVDEVIERFARKGNRRLSLLDDYIYFKFLQITFNRVFCFQPNFNCIFGISQLASRNSSLKSTRFLSKYMGDYEVVNIDHLLMKSIFHLRLTKVKIYFI